jgi:prepilin-type N-terminal cleavage/methylation domain-containing protein
MNTNKANKGFTLVELIVAMAIIVILASVTFIGFRNYIVKANMSKDMEMVTEINTIIRAESFMEDFDRPEDLTEARAMIDRITNDRFPYEARVDGYHFWFHLGRLEVMLSTVEDMASWSDTESLGSMTMTLSERPSTKQFNLLPEGFLYEESRPVLFLEFEGSPLADVISAFGNVSDHQTYTELYDMIDSGRLDGISREKLIALFGSTIFSTNEGNFMMDDALAGQIIFAQGIETITNLHIGIDGEQTTADPEAPVVMMNRDIAIPSSVGTIMEHALMVSNPEAGHVFSFDVDENTVLDIAEPAFTNATFVTNDGSYRIENRTELVKNNETTTLSLSYKTSFMVGSFDVLADGAANSGSLTRSVGDTLVLSVANVLSTTGGAIVSNAGFTFTSSDESVAIASPDGSVATFASGNVTLGVTANGTDVTRTILLTVLPSGDENAPVTYDFANDDITGFVGHSDFDQDATGITSVYGEMFIGHSHDVYDITLTATLSEKDATYGGYGIFIETTIDDNGDDTGLIVQFDRGYNAIVIRPRIDGREQGTILNVKHEDNPAVPDSKRDAWWTASHTILIQVRNVEGMPAKKALTVYVDASKVIDGFVFDANQNEGTSVTGLRSWGVSTNYRTMTIQGSSAVSQDESADISAIVSDMMEAGLFDDVRLKYMNSNAASGSWSKDIETYLETDRNEATYSNRYGLVNPLSTTYNGQAVINWHNFNINSEFDHPAFLITNDDEFAHDNVTSSRHFERLLGAVVFIKTDDKSSEVSVYMINTDGTLSDVQVFDLLD